LGWVCEIVYIKLERQDKLTLLCQEVLTPNLRMSCSILEYMRKAG
jgi:hypothetical protein